MKRHHVSSISKTEANKLRGARGFASFKEWAKQNREGARLNERKGRKELAEILDGEYDTYIAPNL